MIKTKTSLVFKFIILPFQQLSLKLYKTYVYQSFFYTHFHSLKAMLQLYETIHTLNFLNLNCFLLLNLKSNYFEQNFFIQPKICLLKNSLPHQVTLVIILIFAFVLKTGWMVFSFCFQLAMLQTQALQVMSLLIGLKLIMTK